MKYKIDRELFPFSHLKPPINEKFLKLVVPHMKPPRCMFKDKELVVCRHGVESYDGEKIECFLISPKRKTGKIPCLIYIHGGGFVLEAAGYHYKNAMRYAREIGCSVLFVNYRLAPKSPHPVFFEDCYAAMCWAYDKGEELGIDRDRMAIGGDSAGSTLSAKIFPMTKVSRDHPDYVYFSPIEAESLMWLPPAYIETAEFDCLHDDGILYAKRLKEAGIEVVLNETKGTMHGFDIAQGAGVTKSALEARISFMKKMLGIV